MRHHEPKRGIDWDLFEISSRLGPILQVQRIDETDSLTDVEAIECAIAAGIDCDDLGYVIGMGENE